MLNGTLLALGISNVYGETTLSCYHHLALKLLKQEYVLVCSLYPTK